MYICPIIILFSHVQVPKSPPKGVRPQTCRGRVQLSRVHFSYPARPHVEVGLSSSYLALMDPSSQILKGLSVDVEPGQKVAIVGPSGNGKSTIIQLIQQLYTPTSGLVH